MSEYKRNALLMGAAFAAVIIYGIPILIASEICNCIIDWVAAIW